jgi:hypothetical protein
MNSPHYFENSKLLISTAHCPTSYLVVLVHFASFIVAIDPMRIPEVRLVDCHAWF